MDTVSLSIIIKEISDSSISTVSNSVTSSPSAICGTAANSTGQFLEVKEQ
jgi:hypothetical protein